MMIIGGGSFSPRLRRWSRDQSGLETDLGVHQLGHRAPRLDAIDGNVSRSTPGIFAVTVRCSVVMEKPSPSFSMTTSDLLSTCSGTKFGHSEHSDKRHREARGVRCAEQLFGVSAWLLTVTSEEAIGLVFQRAALGRDRPLPSRKRPFHLVDPKRLMALLLSLFVRAPAGGCLWASGLLSGGLEDCLATRVACCNS